MAVLKNQRLELLNYLRTEEPPKNFHTHALGDGTLQEYCVFCKDPVDFSTVHDHGYSIALYGKVAIPIDRHEIRFEDQEVECSICINCSNEIANFEEGDEEKPSDTVGNLDQFLKKGVYPPNIIEFSLSESADQYCGFCRVDLDVYNYENCESHTIPPGYNRDAIESNKIPGPLLMCPECRDTLRESTNNGHFQGRMRYTIDICCDCHEKTIITQTEYDYRIDNPGDYLCHECANERGLKGLLREMHRVCSECDKPQKIMDILKEKNSLKIGQIYTCNKCQSSPLIRNYVGNRLCVEVFTHNNKGSWTYSIFKAHSTDENHDEIIHTSSKEWDKSWKATFIGTIKALEILRTQLELPFNE